MSWRRFGVFVRQLPRDSALGHELLGDAAEWGIQEHLLAAILDDANVAVWQRANANAPKHRRSKPPDRIPRPGVRGEPGQMSDHELAGRLLEFKARTAS